MFKSAATGKNTKVTVGGREGVGGEGGKREKDAKEYPARRWGITEGGGCLVS